MEIRFELSESQVKKYEDWALTHPCKYRATPGKYFATNHNRGVGSAGDIDSFIFTPTTIGTVVTVECGCGEKLDLTEDL